jgi:phosphoribosyl 1,2-cyclic phosphodiesterase
MMVSFESIRFSNRYIGNNWLRKNFDSPYHESTLTQKLQKGLHENHHAGHRRRIADAIPIKRTVFHPQISTDSGKHVLLDCGEGATRQMVRANINPADVGVVFLTHLHHDHICDFPYFVISGWMLNRNNAPVLLGPKGTKRFCDHLFEDGAYQADFMARSAYPLRQAIFGAVRPDVREISPGLVYEDDEFRVVAAHVDRLPHEVCECFGVRVEVEGKSIAFSGRHPALRCHG